MKKGIFLLLCCVVLSSMIVSGPAHANFFDSNYKWNESEGRWVVKGRLGVALADATEDYVELGVPVPQRAVTQGNFFDDSMNVELEVNYRWTDHLSFAATLGYQPHTNDVWRSAVSSLTDSGKMTLMPISAIVQYNFAPYGQIRPYAGVGYHYTKVLSTYDRFKVKNSNGLVLQLGADWWLQEHWGINFDIKKYWIDTTVDLSGLTGYSLTNDATIDPLTFGLGVMHRF